MLISHNMRNSTRFRELRKRIVELRKHFLPRKFEPTGAYTARQFDRARAFRLLAHAEIESYLEDVTLEAANKAFDIWRKRGVISPSLVAMVAYVEENLGDVPTTKDVRGERELVARVRHCKDRFNTYVRTKNHGITERNILKLLLSVGISEYDIDSTWMATTNSFGGSRGKTAHRSNQVDQPPDPLNELDIVKQILDGLSCIDRRLLKLHFM